MISRVKPDSSVVISVRFDCEEFAQLLAEADAKGVSVESHVKLLALDRPEWLLFVARGEAVQIPVVGLIG